MKPTVVGLGKCPEYSFSKLQIDSINLIQGIGVEGDVHAGEKVKHRSRVRKDPNQPNLRQVHLIHSELFDELRQQGFQISPGDVGENITTRGLDVLELSAGALLKIGTSELIVTGLRNPCGQLDNFQSGLLKAVLGEDEDGNLVRKCGVMAVVKQSGKITMGDQIVVESPEVHQPLQPV